MALDLSKFLGGKTGSVTYGYGPFRVALPDYGVSEKYFNVGKYAQQPEVKSYNTTNTSNDTGFIGPVQQPSNNTGGNTGSNTGGTVKKPTNTGGGGSDGYSKTDIFKSLGLNPADSRKYYAQYGVDNALDFQKAYTAQQTAQQANPSGLRDLINQRADSYISSLNDMYGKAPTRQAEDIGSLDTSKQNMVSSLDQSRNYATQNLASRKAGGIRQLAENFRSAGDAANMIIGAAGGGSSSAVPMASYALQKLANKGGNELTRQQMASQAEVDNTYQTELANINTWYNDNAKSVSDYYRSYIDKLDAMKVDANDMRAEALYNVQAGIIEKAQKDLDYLRAEATQRQQQLENYRAERLASLNNVRLAMANSANFDPYSIVDQEMSQAYPSFGSTSQAYDPYNMGVSYNKKKSVTDYMS